MGSMMSLIETADRLGVSLSTVRRKFTEDEVPIHKIGEGRRARVLVDERDVERWLRSKRTKLGRGA